MKFIIWFLLSTTLASPAMAEQKLRPAKHSDFLQVFDDLKLEENHLRQAYEKHVGQVQAHRNVVTMKTRTSWGRFSAEFNQGLNAVIDYDKVRKKSNYEQLLNCKGIKGIKCSLTSYHSSLKDLWTLFNKHMSGRTPASQKEINQVELKITSAKKNIVNGLKKLKGT